MSACGLPVRRIFDKSLLFAVALIAVFWTARLVTSYPSFGILEPGDFGRCFYQQLDTAFAALVFSPAYCLTVSGPLKNAFDPIWVVRYPHRSELAASLLPSLAARSLLFALSVDAPPLVVALICSERAPEALVIVLFIASTVLLHGLFFCVESLLVLAAYLVFDSMPAGYVIAALYGSLDYLLLYTRQSGNALLYTGWNLTGFYDFASLCWAAVSSTRLLAFLALLALACLRAITLKDIFGQEAERS